MNFIMKFKQIMAWVLTVALSGILVDPVNKLFGLIPWTKFIDLDAYSWLINPVLHISVLHILLFVIILATSLKVKSVIARKLEKKQEVSNEELHAGRVRQLKSFNQLTFTDDPTIQARWTVSEPSIYNAHYHSINIELFCLNHPMPLMMQNRCCPDPSCKNRGLHISINNLRNQIDSLIIENARQLGLE